MFRFSRVMTWVSVLLIALAPTAGLAGRLVLARVDGAPVLVRQGRVIACSFHPELGDDPRVHSLLLADAAPGAR